MRVSQALARRANSCLRILGGAAVAAMAVGCGSHGPAVRPTAGPTPSPSSAAQLQLPIAAYEFSAAQSQEEQYVKQRLVQACMATYGFSYLPELSSSTITNGVQILQEFNSRRYGVSDGAAARSYGYHIPAWAAGSGPRGLKAQFSRAELLVLDGPATGPGTRSASGSQSPASGQGTKLPTGGCEGRANSELLAAGINDQSRGNGGGASALAEDIEGQAFAQTQSDHRVLAVYTAWSECMRQHGYDYSTPFKAAADPQWNMSVPPTQTEIQTAEADVSCKFRTNLLGITYAVESDYENAAIAKNALALAQLKSQVAAQAKKLEYLLARYGG